MRNQHVRLCRSEIQSGGRV